MNSSEDRLASICLSAIKDFVNAIRPTHYSRDEVQGVDLLQAEIQLNQSWSDFEELSESGWAAVRKELTQMDESRLWYYALRMAEMAVRRNDKAFIRFGLMAIVVDANLMDYRDLGKLKGKLKGSGAYTGKDK